MARIELSPSFNTGTGQQSVAYRMLGVTNDSGSNTPSVGAALQLYSKPYNTTATYTGGTFAIMQGNMPSDVNNIGPIASSGVLLAWQSNLYANTNNFVHSAELVTINLPFIAAAVSGSATWFYLKTHAFGGSWYDQPQIHGIIGSVGIIGSGADLEIASTTIVSGNQYRIVNFKMAFPYYLDY